MSNERIHRDVVRCVMVLATLFLPVSSGFAILVVSDASPAPGSELASAAFVRILNEGAGGDVKYVLLGGRLQQQRSDPSKPLGLYDTIIGQAIADAHDLTASVIYGSLAPAGTPSVLFDQFMPDTTKPGEPSTGQQYFDVQDLLLLPASSPVLFNRSVWAMHGIYELYLGVVGPADYKFAHSNALAQENTVSTLRGGPTRTLESSNVTVNFDAAGNWSFESDVDPFGPAANRKVLFRGSGDSGNVKSVSGPFFGEFPAQANGDVLVTSIIVVPAPSTLALFGLSLAGLAAARRRKKSQTWSSEE